MIEKYFGGTVVKSLPANEEEPDAEFKATVTGTVAKVIAKADELRIADAISEVKRIWSAKLPPPPATAA